MSRCTLRSIFTILIYAGVGVFLFPYVTGHLGGALLYLIIGIGIAVVCGVLRCSCMEGDCTEREYTDRDDQHKLSQSGNAGSQPHAPSGL